MTITFITTQWPTRVDKLLEDWYVKSTTKYIPKAMWRSFADKAKAQKIEKAGEKPEYRYSILGLLWLIEQGHSVEIDGIIIPNVQGLAEFEAFAQKTLLPKKMGHAWAAMSDQSAKIQYDLTQAILVAAEKAPKIPVPQRSFTTDGPIGGIDIQGNVFVRYYDDEEQPETIEYDGTYLITQELQNLLCCLKIQYF